MKENIATQLYSYFESKEINSTDRALILGVYSKRNNVLDLCFDVRMNK